MVQVQSTWFSPTIVTAKRMPSIAAKASDYRAQTHRLAHGAATSHLVLPVLPNDSKTRLGVGFIGSGFNARFHMLSWQGVRDADVLGVWSPNAKHAQMAAAYANSLDVGACKPYRSIKEMVADPAIDAIWLCGPNQARIANVEEIVDTIARGRDIARNRLRERWRNVAEAKQVLALARSVRLKQGYLENQAFAPQVERGRELL
jgi:hypothetical protein